MMMAGRKHKRFLKGVVLLCAALMLALWLLPVPVQASENSIHSIDLTVDFNDDGSAQVTEVWSVTAGASESTELYKDMPNMDGYTISNFTVQDESGRYFEDTGAWNVDASREEKAGRSGVVEKTSGYELCWGFGTLGDHVYTLSYRLDGLVRAYQDADGMVFTFVGENMSDPIGRVSAVLRKEGASFVNENTRMWLAGNRSDTTGDIRAEGGVIVAEARNVQDGSSFDLMLAFEKGVFHPATEGWEYDFETVQDDQLRQVEYQERKAVIEQIIFFVVIGLFVAVFVVVIIAVVHSNAKFQRKIKAYKDAPYSRKLPWGGSLPATYVRLKELRQLPDDGAVIGAYILGWIRSRQVDITTSENWRGKEQTALRLYAPRGEMSYEERQLYGMLLSAAGSDGILQEKEFKKWSEKNYKRPESWLEEMKNRGKQTIRNMGGVTDVPAKVLGFISYTKSDYTAKGEQLTAEMFGFSKFLEDFTIINEREAREVQLWDRYLVYAQLFGIAEKVAEQFQALYPDYFRPMTDDYNSGGLSYFDMMMISRMASGYGRAMHSGFTAGHSEASGGGGSMGGGGFSGGGSGGGGGFR